jgi:diguanylate cyclase (GGDEF)-like protein/PAS domain S-box-containing protein
MSAMSRTVDSFDDGFLFRALLDSMPDSVYVKDRDARLLRVSLSMVRNLGYADRAEIVGKSDVDLFGEDFGHRTYLEDLRVMETDEPIAGLIESRLLDDGGQNWTLTTKLPVHDRAGRVIGLLGITREINELKQAEMSLQYLATHDTLTALPNRFLMMDRLNQVLARAERDGSSCGVLFVDLDDFKAINDSAGHEAGDGALRAIAERMQSCVRASDTVARLGGDEFVIVLEHATISEATVVADRVRAAIAGPITLGARRHVVTASVGISLYPDHAGDASGLLTAADYAMYLAKRNGKNRTAVCPTGERGAGAVAAGAPPAGRRRKARGNG